MKYSKAIILIALVILASVLISWIKPHEDFLIKNEIINGPYKVKYEIKNNVTELHLACAMGPYVGGSQDNGASVSDLKENIRNFSHLACSGEYILNKNKAKILMINPGEEYRTISAKIKCTNQNTPYVDVAPQKLCKSLLNYDGSIF